MDMQLVSAGIMLEWEWRVKWLGETESQAKEILKSANKEKGITYEDD